MSAFDVSRPARTRRAYRTAFATPDGRRVLRDLHRFCMETAPTADPHEAVFTMGMQRVWRRIAAMADPAVPDPTEFETQESDDD